MKELIVKCFEENEWNLVELSPIEKENVKANLKKIEREHLIKFPTELIDFIILFWKEEITMNHEDVDYYLFKSLPSKELDEYAEAMKAYHDYGTLPNAIPFGIDEFGNWLLINCTDGSIWVEDTDFEKNIRLADSLSSFLSGEVQRFQ